MENNDLILNVQDKPKILNWILLSLQHVFAMFGATILVPIIVNEACGQEIIPISVALITSGLGTLIYIVCTKKKSPIYLGSSFAFITPVITAVALGDKSSAFTGIMTVGIVYIIVAILIKILGVNFIKKILPPIIVGPMIMIIGLSLAPTAINQIGIVSQSTINYKTLIVALITFLTTILVMLKGKKIFSVIPFLIGIIVGYITSICFGIVDFAGIQNVNFFSMPNFYFPIIDYSINFKGVLTIAPIALVTIAEHIGDHTVLGSIINKDLIKDPGLHRTLLGDGLATFIAGFLGGPANTSYGENTSVVGITKVASIYVIALAAIIAILFGFLGQFTFILSTIPNAVLGGISLILYGYISVNGLRVIVENQIDFRNNKNIIIASSMLVLGLGGASITFAIKDITIALSGMVLAAVVGIILNICLPKKGI